ncbi:peptide-methionine (R)-S-oxide reductase MsrB [Thalassotalea ponticola]|uniref:peptide-methionine (R)-S-oxide reductase MsrB n=1 Tax=Thalassotalea ponticola TaxID=1523392 RepID=UPI0025B2E8E7|nr:peptide-methionine (R)-S-oxide reductase MsrB [Thalassotalea ponticola]MDN3651525.1 peptide-methionine (R)-S-oxide reductase MsrB [Thalassotalea ponticola]
MAAEDKYKSILSEQAYEVCRLGATEAPYSGKYYDHWLTGTYHCACCNTPLFSSSAKFQSHCGWPSFFQALPNCIKYVDDYSHHMIRVEIKCQCCDAHLGHVFDDGPEPTFKRYCVNSLSLQFIAAPDGDPD